MTIPVSKEQFTNWFVAALEQAAINAEEYLGVSRIPRNFLIDLHAGPKGEIHSIDEAVDKLYIGNDLSWLIIDVAVQRIEGDNTTVFVRPSGHDPEPWPSTWKFDEGKGPFNQMIYQGIEIVD